jgi:hypothetical protein
MLWARRLVVAIEQTLPASQDDRRDRDRKSSTCPARSAWRITSVPPPIPTSFPVRGTRRRLHPDRPAPGGDDQALPTLSSRTSRVGSRSYCRRAQR